MCENNDLFRLKQPPRAAEEFFRIQLVDHVGKVVLIIPAKLRKLLFRRSRKAVFFAHKGGRKRNRAECFLHVTAERFLERDKVFKPESLAEPQHGNLGGMRARAHFL